MLREEKRIRLFEAEDDQNQTGVLSIQIEGIDRETAAELLGEHGVAVRAGLHCAPLAHRTAGTIEQGTVRLSMSPFTTERDAVQATQAIRRLL